MFFPCDLPTASTLTFQSTLPTQSAAGWIFTAYQDGQLTNGPRSLPHIEDRVHEALVYLRLNTLAEIFHISQPTVCPLTTALDRYLQTLVELACLTFDDIDPYVDLIVDATLRLNWDFKDLLSGGLF